jgi:hypothetical protein
VTVEALSSAGIADLSDPLPLRPRGSIFDRDSGGFELFPDRIGSREIATFTRCSSRRQLLLDGAALVTDLEGRHDVQNVIYARECRNRTLERGNVLSSLIELGVRLPDEGEQCSHRERSVQIIEKCLRRLPLDFLSGRRQRRRSSLCSLQPVVKIPYAPNALDRSLEGLG